jgi:hypothetical protein
MRLLFLASTISLFVSFGQLAIAADDPATLIVGKWRDRAEPDDAVIEFHKDGRGRIVEIENEKSVEVKTLWKIAGTYGNACIVVVKYDVPKPNEIKSLTWLIAFDGNGTFVAQPAENKIVFMDRQK